MAFALFGNNQFKSRFAKLRSSSNGDTSPLTRCPSRRWQGRKAWIKAMFRHLREHGTGLQGLTHNSSASGNFAVFYPDITETKTANVHTVRLKSSMKPARELGPR